MIEDKIKQYRNVLQKKKKSVSHYLDLYRILNLSFRFTFKITFFFSYLKNNQVGIVLKWNITRVKEKDYIEPWMKK